MTFLPRPAALVTLGCSLVLSIGCDDDSIFHQQLDVDTDISRELCDCDTDPADCRAELEERRSSGTLQVELDCLAEAYGAYSDSLDPSYQCDLDTLSEARDCISAASCDEAAIGSCEDDFFDARDLCPVPDETAEDAFYDEVEVCYEARIVGVPEGGCPNETASGTGNVLTVSTIGRGHDVDITCGGENAPDVTVAWTAPTTGTYRISTVGSDYDTMLGVFASCGGAEIACNDDGDEGLTSSVEIPTIEGTEYIIVLGGYGNEGGRAQLTIEAL